MESNLNLLSKDRSGLITLEDGNKLEYKLSLIYKFIKNKVSSLFNRIFDLKLKEIYIIYFLWFIWLINLAIYTDKDISDLPFFKS